MIPFRGVCFSTNKSQQFASRLLSRSRNSEFSISFTWSISFFNSLVWSHPISWWCLTIWSHLPCLQKSCLPFHFWTWNLRYREQLKLWNAIFLFMISFFLNPAFDSLHCTLKRKVDGCVQRMKFVFEWKHRKTNWHSPRWETLNRYHFQDHRVPLENKIMTH